MKLIKNLSILSLILIFVLSACSNVEAPATETMEETSEVMEETMDDTSVPEDMPDTGDEGSMDDSMMEDESMESDSMGDEEMLDDEAMQDDSMNEEMADSDAEMADDEMMDEDSGMMDTPVFFDTALTNAATGESFKLNDFAGKVVLVETMAIWCPTCLRQQMEVKEIQSAFEDRDDFVTVILDIDPNENEVDLKIHVGKNGFQGYYAVAPAEVSSEIGNLYGSQFLNPPSTPMFIIDRHGEVHLLPFGLKDMEELQEAVEMYL